MTFDNELLQKMNGEPTRKTGRCVKFIASKGYGFLEPDDNRGHDVFVHISDIVGGNIAIGDRVTFEIQLQHNARSRAKDVRLEGP